MSESLSTTTTPPVQGPEFLVTVQPSGRTFRVAPGESILAAGIGQSVGLPYGCRDGACGSCICKLLSGDVTLVASKALTADDRAGGLILTCRARPATDIVLQSMQVTAEGAFAVRKMPARITSLTRLSPDVMHVALQLPANAPLQYHAGQYVDILLRDGARRSYSMATAPSVQPAIELHIRHMPGGKFTDAVFGSMQPRDMVRLEGPFGSFYLRDSDSPIILLASGTGFAPIKALLECMARDRCTRPVSLYWGGRRPHDIYLDAWVEEQASALPQLRYVPVVSDARADDAWNGRTGFVHLAVLQDFADLSHHQVYACGAPVVVESARRDFCALADLPPEQFFADAFTSEADKAQAAQAP